MSIKPRRFSPLLEQLVPPDHELRRIDRLLHFSFVRRQVRSLYSSTGRPSIDPAVILRLFFLLFFYGIRSERRLMQEVQFHVAYRWFIGYDLTEPLPHYSVLAKARARWGLRIFQKLFDRIVHRCLRLGLIEGRTTFLDATILRANASRDHLNNSQLRPPGVRLNDLLPSPTDPESGLTKRKGQRSFYGYRAHRAIDPKARVITETQVTAADPADEWQLPALVEGQRRHGLDPQEVVADSIYGTGVNYCYLLERGKVAHIKRRHSGRRRGRFALEDFVYDPARDCLICPQGKVLSFLSGVPEGKLYRARWSDCRICPVRARCTSGKSQRRVLRSWHQEAIEGVQGQLGTPRAQENLKKRRVICEGSFAEGKNFHNLRRALYRGRWKVQMQEYLIATVQNLKRLLRWEANHELKPAPATS